MKKLTISEMNRLSPEQFHAAQKLPLVVVLDNVRSLHNIGAVFRTADAFLIEGVYLCGICCCPPNVEMHKTALGAEQTVDWSYFKNTIDAVHELKQRGYQVFAIEQAHDSQTLDEVLRTLPPYSSTPLPLSSPSGGRPNMGCREGAPIAVVLGHEVFGVDQAVIDACDGCIELPQYGTKHSLNVSVTAGIVMYEIATWMRNK